MLSLDIESHVEIPKMVLMYFAFDSSLDTMRNSYLYEYVYRNKTRYPELYSSYEDAIERFTMFQLLAGNNNKHLSYLYKNLISESVITEDTAKGMVKALFTHSIKLLRKDIRLIIVKYENLDTEFRYNVNSNEVYVPLYGANYSIILEDKYNNRFVGEDSYEVSRLMLPDRFVKSIIPYVDDVLFDLYISENFN